MGNKEIIFRSSAIILKDGKNEKAKLTWDAKNAKNVELRISRIGNLKVAIRGEYTVQPAVTTQYTLIATFADGSTQSKTIEISLIQEPQVCLYVEHLTKDNNVYAHLIWGTSGVSEVKLDNTVVSGNGYENFLVTETKEIKLVYTSPFGTGKRIVTLEPTNKLKYWMVRVLYALIKLILRPFTFFGTCSPKEYKWTSWIIWIGIVIVIGSLILSYYDKLGEFSFYFSQRFQTFLIEFSCLFYLWLMCAAKRLKDCGVSPWYILWGLPLFLIDLTPCLATFFGNGCLIILICYPPSFMFLIGITEEIDSKKSHFNIVQEFTPSFLLTNDHKIVQFKYKIQ